MRNDLVLSVQFTLKAHKSIFNEQNSSPDICSSTGIQRVSEGDNRLQRSCEKVKTVLYVFVCRFQRMFRVHADEYSLNARNLF